MADPIFPVDPMKHYARGTIISQKGSGTKHLLWLQYEHSHPETLCGVVLDGRNLDEDNANKRACPKCLAGIRSELKDVDKEKENLLGYLERMKGK